MAELFNESNGLACERDDGDFQIRGLQDGAWYWITKAQNTAVSFMMSRGILSNPKIAPANPGGDGFRFTVGRHGAASFVEEVATGRVAILPHILPLPDERLPPPCGQYKEGEGEATRQRADDCLMDASYWVRVARFPGPTAVTGGQILRPTTGSAELELGLYGTGHLDVENPLGAGFDASLVVTTWEVTAQVEGVPGLPATLGTDRVWGVTPNLSTGRLTVHASGDSDGMCTPTEKYTLALDIKATAGVNAVLPPVPSNNTTAGDLRPWTSFRILCPGSVASSARELVPEHPFPGQSERGGS